VDKIDKTVWGRVEGFSKYVNKHSGSVKFWEVFA
jgi:hypothetical protein